MRHIKIAFWAALALLAALWLAADPLALQPSGFFALRGSMVQISGVLAMTCMSLAMILARAACATKVCSSQRWRGR